MVDEYDVLGATLGSTSRSRTPVFRGDDSLHRVAASHSGLAGSALWRARGALAGFVVGTGCGYLFRPGDWPRRRSRLLLWRRLCNGETKPPLLVAGSENWSSNGKITAHQTVLVCAQ